MKRTNICRTAIIFLAVLSVLPLLIDPTRLGHDGNFHFRNALYLSEDLFRLSPLVPETANGLGYGLYLFYPPLPHRILAFLTFFLKDVRYAYVLLCVLLSVFSAETVFELGRKFFRHEESALVLAVFFLFFPYRIGDLIVRFALNESFLFLFVPLGYLSLEYLKEGKRKVFFFTFVMAFAGMATSHLLLTAFFTVLYIPYLLLHAQLLWKEKKLFLSAVFFTFLTAAPFLISVLTVRKYDYRIFEEGVMTSRVYMDYFGLNLTDFFNTDINYDWDVLNYLSWPLIPLFLYSFFVSREKKQLYFLLLSLFCFFFCLKIFPWDLLPEGVYIIQFPWRMETFLTLSLPLCAVYALDQLKRGRTAATVVFLWLSMVFMAVPLYKLSLSPHHTPEVLAAEEALGHSQEYLPAAMDPESLSQYEQQLYLLSGEAKGQITENDLSSLSLSFTLSDVSEAQIVLPRLFYPGYELTLDGRAIPLQEAPNGLLLADLQEAGDYQLRYAGIPAVRIAGWLRAAGWLFVTVISGNRAICKR
ncbi:MAG: hypothetical protein IKE21_03780 [Erysipelotrichaceae bacterium]|nr:hypothetical protein [Erysipelotrichaceae bacterium]